MTTERVQPTWHDLFVRFAIDTAGEPIAQVATPDRIVAALRLLLDLPEETALVLDDAVLTATPRWRTTPS